MTFPPIFELGSSQFVNLFSDFYFHSFIILGTILGATEMITGFPPSNLLMTSA